MVAAPAWRGAGTRGRVDPPGDLRMSTQPLIHLNPHGTGARHASSNGAAPDMVRLRVRGAQLLRAAAEVNPKEHPHPAYARILTELDPDEARILRLLATEGPQPSVDVRA